MSATVRVSARADREARRARKWWQEHRPSAASLFEDEYRFALEYLATAPATPRVVARIRNRDVRRILLPRSRYHIYYAYDASRTVVVVLSVWSARREKPPY